MFSGCQLDHVGIALRTDLETLNDVDAFMLLLLLLSWLLLLLAQSFSLLLLPSLLPTTCLQKQFGGLLWVRGQSWRALGEVLERTPPNQLLGRSWPPLRWTLPCCCSCNHTSMFTQFRRPPNLLQDDPKRSQMAAKGFPKEALEVPKRSQQTFQTTQK